MMKVVVVMAVKMCIMVKWNLYWSRFQICIQTKTEFFSVGNSRSSSCPAYTVY